MPGGRENPVRRPVGSPRRSPGVRNPRLAARPTGRLVEPAVARRSPPRSVARSSILGRRGRRAAVPGRRAFPLPHRRRAAALHSVDEFEPLARDRMESVLLQLHRRLGRHRRHGAGEPRRVLALRPATACARRRPQCRPADHRPRAGRAAGPVRAVRLPAALPTPKASWRRHVRRGASGRPSA